VWFGGLRGRRDYDIMLDDDDCFSEVGGQGIHVSERAGFCPVGGELVVYSGIKKLISLHMFVTWKPTA